MSLTDMTQAEVENKQKLRLSLLYRIGRFLQLIFWRLVYHIIPPSYHFFADSNNAIRNLECPICGVARKRFLDFGLPIRKNAQCPACGSLERHRLLFLVLKKLL
jgi:rubredoxin